MNYVAGGAGRALLFLGEQLYSVGNTLNNNAIHYTISAEDLRGGKKNFLIAQYFHDPNMTIDLENVFFNFNEIGLVTGNTVEQGGLSFKEEQVVAAAGGIVTPTQTPIAPVGMAGKILVWYKKPADKDWKDVIYNNGVTIPGATVGDVYCIKYFWDNPNAESMTLNANSEPAELQLVLIQDLYSVSVQKGVTTPGAKAGQAITICPRYKLNGNIDLNFAAGSTVGTSLSGTVLTVEDDSSCEGDYIFGYMTQEIFGAKWQNEVKAIAFEDADIALANGGTQTLVCYVLFDGNKAPKIVDNANFTFAVEDGDTFVGVDAKGVVTAKTAGTAHISATLKGADTSNGPAVVGYAEVTVTG